MNDLGNLADFIENWQDQSAEVKKVFVSLKEYLEGKEGVSFEFIEREGVTYSLRAKHAKQNEQPLFTMIDVIDTDPRWLSVCFYANMVQDPESLGDVVPGGLLGEDGMCFDVEDYSDDLVAYLKQRFDDAIATVNQ